MQVHSDTFTEMQMIPSRCAFGMPGPAGEPFAPAPNRNPHLAWDDIASERVRSFVLTCVDHDVPSRGDDVNRTDRRVPATLPRVDFVHWLLVDIPRECRELAEGSCADGIVARGKREPPGPPGSKQGVNDFSGWFAHDKDMAGTWFGYDGPCPPWNDELAHHYEFTVRALDVPTLGLTGAFTLGDVERAMAGHVVASASLTGVYSLTPGLRR